MNKNFTNNFLDFVVRNLRVFVICLVAGMVVSFMFCKFFVQPKYRATATAAISLSEEYVENITQSVVQIQTELTDALVNYFDEDYLFEEFSKNLPEGLSRNYTKNELMGMFETSNKEGTFILQLSAVSHNASDAAILANAFLEMALDKTLNLIGVGFREPVEAATVPKGHFYPNYLSAAFVGALLGAVVFALVSFLIMFFNNRVMTKNDLEETFPEVPVISEIADYSAVV